MEAEFADVCVLKASYGAKDDPKTIRGVLAVGGADSRSALVRQIGESHGVAQPEDAVEVVSREQWDLLRRLEKLGIISFATDGVQNVIERSDAAEGETERLDRVCGERRARAEAEARRLVQMGELLTTGGFAQEGMASCRKAIALAAGAAAYSTEDVRAERSLEPVTVATLVAVRTALALDPEEALVLQLAVQDLDLDNAPAKAKDFVERVFSAGGTQTLQG